MADGSPLEVPHDAIEVAVLCEKYHALPRKGGLDRQYVTMERGIEALRIYRAFAAFASCKSYTEISAGDWEVIQPLQELDPELRG